MSFTIYKLTHAESGKSYIGMTGQTLSARWGDHRKRAAEGSRVGNALYDAISEHGADAFTMEALMQTEDRQEAERLEAECIEKFDTYENGYNCNLGGAGFLVFPEHIKRKVSEGQKGKIISAETRKRMSEAKMGDSRCAEHFGDFTNKGADNPQSKSYLIRFPDGSEHVITGMRAFCREHGLTVGKLTCGKKRTKGYVLLRRFNDQSESSYTQAGGSGGGPGA